MFRVGFFGLSEGLKFLKISASSFLRITAFFGSEGGFWLVQVVGSEEKIICRNRAGASSNSLALASLCELLVVTMETLSRRMLASFSRREFSNRASDRAGCAALSRVAVLL